MQAKTPVKVPESIQENIFAYRFKNFLKECGKAHSGNLSQLIERIESNLTNEAFKEKFLSFLTEELSNGKNRQIYLSRFEIANLAVLNNFMSIQSNLAAAGLKFENFNNFLSDDLQNEEMVYLNIEKDESEQDPTKAKVRKIEICFYKEIQPSEEVTGKEKFTDYVWVEIHPSEQLIIFKIRPHNQQYLTNYYTSKKTYEEIFTILKNVFPLKIMKMEYAKGVFFTIFKELTEIAEQPYREKIEEHDAEIQEFQKKILPLIGISKATEIEDITIRYKRLLERNLIVNDIDNYLSYHNNRKGIVERISLTDLSGASANVLSGDSDGLDVADIYFDIRETIDGMKKLDKLWIKWFLFDRTTQENEIELFEGEEVEEGLQVLSTQKDERTVQTRFEVAKDYVIINFVKQLWVSKEVQDHVLSTFIEFEEKANQQS